MPDRRAVPVYGFSLALDLPPPMDMHKQVTKHGSNTAKAQETQGLTGTILMMLSTLLDGTAT